MVKEVIPIHGKGFAFLYESKEEKPIISSAS